jgi:hypothetical protein
MIDPTLGMFKARPVAHDLPTVEFHRGKDGVAALEFTATAKTTLVVPLAASSVGMVQAKDRDAEETEQQEKAGLFEPLKPWEALP